MNSKRAKWKCKQINSLSSELSLDLRGLPRFRFTSVGAELDGPDCFCDVCDADECGRLSVDSTSTKSFSGELARLI